MDGKMLRLRGCDMSLVSLLTQKLASLLQLVVKISDWSASNVVETRFIQSPDKFVLEEPLFSTPLDGHAELIQSRKRLKRLLNRDTDTWCYLLACS